MTFGLIRSSATLKMTMGLIADFVVASPSDALLYASFVGAEKSVLKERFERFQCKNYTNLAGGIPLTKRSNGSVSGLRGRRDRQ
jgi:hypothetical protein